MSIHQGLHMGSVVGVEGVVDTATVDSVKVSRFGVVRL